MKQGAGVMLSGTVKINKTTIVFSDDIKTELTKNKGNYVVLFIDREENKLAFKSSNESKLNFKFSEERKGIVISDFLSKSVSLKQGLYNAHKDEDGKWIIEDCIETKKENTYHSHIEQGEVSLTKSGFFFPQGTTTLPLFKGKDRIELIYKEVTDNYDLILFKPTINKVDGRKFTAQKKGGSILVFMNVSQYKFGRYKATQTNEGFLVKVPKQ